LPGSELPLARVTAFENVADQNWLTIADNETAPHRNTNASHARLGPNNEFVAFTLSASATFLVARWKRRPTNDDE